MARSRSETLRCTCPILAPAGMDPWFMLDVLSDRSRRPSGYNLCCAREAGAKRLLHHHVQEPEALQIPRPLQRTDVYSPQPSVARELRHYLLCPLVMPRDKHVKRLTRYLSLHERAGESRVEGLDDPRASGEPVESLVHGVGDVHDDLPFQFPAKLPGSLQRGRIPHRKDHHLVTHPRTRRFRLHRRTTPRRATQLRGQPPSLLRVPLHDRHRVAAPHQHVADPSPHVPRAYYRDFHSGFLLLSQLRASQVLRLLLLKQQSSLNIV